MTGLAQILDQNELLRQQLAEARAQLALVSEAHRSAEALSLRLADEKARLADEKARLADEKALADEKLAVLTQKAEALAQELDLIRMRLSRPRSERFVPGEHQVGLPFVADVPPPPRDLQILADDDEAETKGPPPRTKTPGRRRDLKASSLPTRRQKVSAPPDAACPACKGSLKVIGETLSRRVDWIPGHFVVSEIARDKCVCPACPDQGVLAPALPHLLPKALCANGLLARVVIDKFADHIPYNRQVSRMAREGLELDTQTLSAWGAAAADRIRPIFDAVVAEVLAGGHVQGDDTGMPVQDGQNGALRVGRLWAFTDQEQAFFAFTPTKHGEYPAALLKDFLGPVVLCDGGSEFNQATLDRVRAGCWSHARRYFVDALDNHPTEAAVAIATIRDLFLIDRHLEGLGPEERLQIRETRSKPLVDAFFDWCRSMSTIARPASLLAKALNYALNQEAPLRVFLDYPLLPLHNNLSELLLRGPVVGRKNWLFAGSEGGAQAACVWFTLIASCRLQAVDPHAYLIDVMARLDDHPATRLHELTPRGWRQARTPLA
jgi:transposase